MVLQWHPAFQAVLQIEFSGEAQYLQFFEGIQSHGQPAAHRYAGNQEGPGSANPKKLAEYSAGIIS